MVNVCKHKVIFFVFIVCVCFLINNSKSCCFASMDEMYEKLMDIAHDSKKMATHLKTCTPVKGKYTEVIGMRNNTCYFKNQGVSCHLPMSVARQYAEASIIATDHFIYDGEASTETKESLFINKIMNDPQYCERNR